MTTRAVFLVCLLVSLSCALNRKQMNGLRRLLTKLPAGTYPTCNLVLFAEQVDYDTAEQRCRSFNLGTATALEGNLATVNDEEKNSDLQLLLHLAYPLRQGDNDRWGPDKWVWAGLRKTRNTGEDGSRHVRKYNANDWSWADGSHPRTFSKWFNRKQPDQGALRYRQRGCTERPKCMQNQMRINHNGKWDDTYKFKKHPYACDYQGKYILSATPRTWHGAKLACAEAGLRMAKVRNVAELHEIVTASKFFLGERDEAVREFDPSNWFWIGGNDLEEEGVYKWSDGELVGNSKWIPWRSPNPDNAEFVGNRGQDVLSISKWGLFDDSYDIRRKRAFACQCPGT